MAKKGRAKEREGGGERAPAIRAPTGSILQSLAAAKFRLVNQTIRGVGRHSVLLFGDRHGHVIESFYPILTSAPLAISPFKPEQEVAMRAPLNGKDVFAVLPTGYGKSLIYQIQDIKSIAYSAVHFREELTLSEIRQCSFKVMLASAE